MHTNLRIGRFQVAVRAHHVVGGATHRLHAATSGPLKSCISASKVSELINVLPL